MNCDICGHDRDFSTLQRTGRVRHADTFFRVVTFDEMACQYCAPAERQKMRVRVRILSELGNSKVRATSRKRGREHLTRPIM